jgi:predicted metal-binding membrane protein
MSMPQQSWYGAAAGYLGTWTAMMVPMMLPSLIPMLSHYRRSVRGAGGMHLHGLMALVGVGYFAIWVIVGAGAHATGVAATAVEMRWGGVAQWLPTGTGVVLLLAGAVQLTSWKARQLVLCREGSSCGRMIVPTALGAWRHGIKLGVRCGLSCGSLMLALLAIGMMDLVAMVAVTLAVSAERLAPGPLRIARLSGVAILVLGALTIVRV